MSATSGLQVALQLTRGRFALAAEFELGSEERLALVGPNGAGKSSLLLTIAGVLAPHAGRLGFAEQTWFDAAGGVELKAPDRPCALVFQRGALFPHLSVLDNIGYGLRAAGESREEARAKARDWLQRVELERLALRFPGELSGGQARIIALLRALATQPKLLLLDEPFAGLDPITRAKASELIGRASHAFEGAMIWADHELRPLRRHTQLVAQVCDGVVGRPQDWESALQAAEDSHLAAMVKAQTQ